MFFHWIGILGESGSSQIPAELKPCKYSLYWKYKYLQSYRQYIIIKAKFDVSDSEYLKITENLEAVIWKN